MRQHHYTFITVWRLHAPLKEVWDRIIDIEEWPNWWKGVQHAQIIDHRGPHGGVGSKIVTHWHSWLPYTIHFTITVTEINHEKLRIAITAAGDLTGTGVWEFQENDGTVTARYTWDVSTTKPWMNFIAPLARPVFANAHHVIMGWGEQGLKKLLEKHS